jgi:arylsulfatase A-like enzyme
VTRRAIDFISEHREQPFFLFLHYFDVHYDYIPPEDYWRRFDPDYRGSLAADAYMRNAAIRADMETRDLEHVIALYDGEILFTDERVGHVIEALDRNGLADETLVVVTSDHGQEFFEHGGKGHARTLFDEVLLVPLIMRWPGRIPAGQRIEAQVRHLDIMPTLLGYAGVPEDLPGMDLSEVVGGRGDPGPVDAVSRLRRKGRLLVSLRTPRLKYISTREGRSKTERLYELSKDPGERRPVFLREETAGSGEARESFERLRGRLAREQRHMGAARADREAVPLDLPGDLEEGLRALGYLEEEEPTTPPPTAP